MKKYFSLKIQLVIILLVSLSLVSAKNPNSIVDKEDNEILPPQPLTKEDNDQILLFLKQLNELTKLAKENKESKENKLKFLSDPNPNNHFEKYDKPFLKHHDGPICKACLWTFKSIHIFFRQKYGLETLYKIIIYLCSFGTAKEVCNGVIHHYGDTVISSLIERYLNEHRICTNLNVCEVPHYKELDPDVYARYLLKDKPKLENKSNLSKVDKMDNKYKVLHVTDIHVDLKYKEDSNTVCNQPLCCRADSVKSTKSSVNSFFQSNLSFPSPSSPKAGPWGSLAACDLPLKTLENFVKTAVSEIKPDFLLWTGDNPPHEIWKSSQSEDDDSSRAFVDLLNKYNYTNPVYPCLGNHDKYPVDLYNPYQNENKTSEESEFLKSMGKIWRQWLDDEAYDMFIRKGYYTMKHLDTNLRILAINSVTCDTFNFFNIKNPTDPDLQFGWMESTLRLAEYNKESVYIVGHIPPGDSSYLTECSLRYNAIADRFSQTIKGHFFGHTHTDEFRTIREYFNKKEIIAVINTAPSLTTYSYLNPSFRVYQIASNWGLNDYLQYRLDIDNVNKMTEVDKKYEPKWDIVYRATNLLKLSNLENVSSYKEVLKNIDRNEDFFKSLLKNFFSGGPNYNYYIKDKKMQMYMKCRFGQDTFDGFLKCTKYRTWTNTDYIMRALEFLSGKWFWQLDD